VQDAPKVRDDIPLSEVSRTIQPHLLPKLLLDVSGLLQGLDLIFWDFVCCLFEGEGGWGHEAGGDVLGAEVEAELVEEEGGVCALGEGFFSSESSSLIAAMDRCVSKVFGKVRFV
jgi:hypothetical protein